MGRGVDELTESDGLTETGDSTSASELPEADGEWVACPHCGARLPAMNMAHFSFNKPAGVPNLHGVGRGLHGRYYPPAG